MPADISVSAGRASYARELSKHWAMPSCASTPDQTINQDPVLDGQGDHRSMPFCYNEPSEPMGVGVAQEPRQCEQKNHEGSFPHQDRFKGCFRRELMQPGSWADSVPPWTENRNYPQELQLESIVSSDPSRSKPNPRGILQRDESGVLLALDDLDEPEGDTSMLRQPETRPISHDQLVAEVKGIYAGLVMVEAKCIEVDKRQKLWAQDKDYASQNPVTADQWRSLITLHKQLLQEHHDFFLASQHPSASNDLSRLAAKYIMPARIWRHGIHGFLERLRHRLPGSLEHMLAFIYIAYNMMALLFETVPSFEDTWIECLGDLGRYRMAIEDDEPRDREVWSNVARYWYSKASDKSPITGRLYHHLAILARPNTMEHLLLHLDSLTAPVSLASAREFSDLFLLDPIIQRTVPTSSSDRQKRLGLVECHAILYDLLSKRLGSSDARLKACRHYALASNVDHEDVRDRTKGLRKQIKLMAYLAIANIGGSPEYGATTEESDHTSQRRASHDVLVASPGDTFNLLDMPLETEKGRPIISPTASFSGSSIFDDQTTDDHNSKNRDLSWTQAVLGLIEIILIFIYNCCTARNGQTHHREVIDKIEKNSFWSAVCNYLNEFFAHQLLVSDSQIPSLGSDALGTDVGLPLPEDFVLRGQVYTFQYFPDSWFSHPNEDDEERQPELPSMDAERIERSLWLGLRTASVCTNKMTAKRWADMILDSPYLR